MKVFQQLEKMYSPEVVDKVRRALKQIGGVKPVYDKDYECWIFEHPDFPESYAGDSANEVVTGYPFYLANMFQAQSEGNLAPFVEARIHWKK